MTYSYSRGMVLAQFDGRCAHCDGAIVEGDQIVYAEEAGGWCLAAHVMDMSRPVVSSGLACETDIDLS